MKQFNINNLQEVVNILIYDDINVDTTLLSNKIINNINNRYYRVLTLNNESISKLQKILEHQEKRYNKLDLNPIDDCQLYIIFDKSIVNILANPFVHRLLMYGNNYNTGCIINIALNTKLNTVINENINYIIHLLNNKLINNESFMFQDNYLVYDNNTQDIKYLIK
jgi:hypothetical protein